MPANRTRLSPEERREQLLVLGARLFATEPYEDVHIERVAETAEVSRGLLYHYFPTKRAFFAALLARAAEQLAHDTAPDPAASPRDQLYGGIERYLAHCAANPAGVRTIHRGTASADPDVEAIIEESTRLHERRILAVLAPDGDADPLLVLAVRGWLMLLRTTAHEWLESGDDRPSLAAVRDTVAGALVGAVASLPDGVRPARLAKLLD